MATIDFSREIDRLKHEMDDLRKDVTRFSRSAREYGAAKGHDALGSAEMLTERARKQMARAEKRVSGSIEDRPFVALLIALGVGFVIAKLLDYER